MTAAQAQAAEGVARQSNGEGSETEDRTPDGNRPEAVINKLAQLDPVEYDRCRKDVAKTLGIRVETLDCEVEKRRPGLGEGLNGPGSPLDLHAPKPWPKPVDGAALLDELVATFKRYLALPDGGGFGREPAPCPHVAAAGMR